MPVSCQAIREYLHSQERPFRSKQFDPEVISLDKVLRYGAPVGARIEEHLELSRCMGRLQELLLLAEQNGKSLENGTVVIAERLGESSGRFTRSWHAPKGGLWLALLWADTLLPQFIRLLPLAIGVACCEAVRAFGVDAALKWVNDVHVDGRKIVGVLSETIVSPIFGERYHLIGIGINVNNTEFPPELTGLAASIRGFTGTKVNLQDLAVCLLAKLTWNLGLLHYQEEQALAAGDSGDSLTSDFSVLTPWRRMTDSIGRRVLYGYDVQQKPLYRATVKELAADGGLVMELENGELITEYGGEIVYLRNGN